MNRCLILDRNSQHREQLFSFCQEEGFEVSSVETLRGARELLAKNLFNIAFIDLDPADGSGLELLDESRLHSAEIIMMSSSEEISRPVAASRPQEPLSLTGLPMTSCTARA